METGGAAFGKLQELRARTINFEISTTQSTAPRDGADEIMRENETLAELRRSIVAAAIMLGAVTFGAVIIMAVIR